MPVFNRLEMTKDMLQDLQAQRMDEALQIVVIDDGSSDGTAQFLAGQSHVTVVKGDGSLWWGGAIEAGLQAVWRSAQTTDWVLFVNNDTHIQSDFVQQLLQTARRMAPAAVGSIIRQNAAPFLVRSVGPKIDAWRMLVGDLLDIQRPDAADSVQQVDALSGRGVLFPALALKQVRGMRPRWLPHYLADYEVSLRVRRAGWKLLVDPAAAVFSEDEYGSTHRDLGWRNRFFSVRSPRYLPAQVSFWWQASTWWQRLSLPLRLALFSVAPRLRNKS